MNSAVTLSRSFAVLVILPGLLGGCRQGERELCVPRSPHFDGEGAGYELINVTGGEVWGTRDWTPEEYAAFSFPLSWTFWLKNDPRIPLTDRGRFLRSPGCAEDGQYCYLRAFGREFLQVVRLGAMNRPADDQGLIRRTELEKHHVLHYAAGRNVSVLRSPTGERFIGVSRSLERSSDTPTLPEGWTLTQHLLAAELQVDLVGRVSVLRMDNEDSYQGPLPEGSSIHARGSRAPTQAQGDER
jgi:hypothetical protein